MYYDLQVYDVPFLRIQQHTDFIEERECQDLMALLQERLHKDNYHTSATLGHFDMLPANIDERCLLLAVLFTTFYLIMVKTKNA